MDKIIELKNVTFSYFDEDEFENDSGEETIKEIKVFDNLNLEFYKGVTSLVGQNGTGKSTCLLLSAGLLFPQKGEVFIEEINTIDLKDNDTERQKYVSFIYQNMEFETEENIEYLLKYVYDNGYYEKKDYNFINELIELCELKKILNRKTQEISKGELQRVIIAFSLLYGSKIIMMDEPIFALENYQKDRIMDYLFKFSKTNNISIIYSAHELDITKKYSDYICYFYKNGTVEMGETKLLFNEEKLEKVFEAPYSMLKRREEFYREGLLK